MAFSKMGKNLRTKDKSYATHKMHYKVVEKEQHDMAIVENVPEYGECHAKEALSSGWTSESVVLDPRCYGQGVARTRRYIVLRRKATMKPVHGITFQEVMDCLKSRPCLGAADYFWQKDCGPSTLTPSQDLQGLNCLE